MASLLSILSSASDPPGKAALEARLSSLPSSPPPPSSSSPSSSTVEAYGAWYSKCFGEIERKMQGVEGGALAAVEAMKEETRRMEGCVRMAEEGRKLGREGGREGRREGGRNGNYFSQ